MNNPLLRSLSLLDASGYVIITIILALLVSAIVLTAIIHARYANIARELRRHSGDATRFDAQVLRRIVHDTLTARELRPGDTDINTQAMIERSFDGELRGLLIGERFIKASTGLFIILGLVGTFYGLTLSIGRLVTLVSGEGTSGVEVTEALMQGLTQALSGMSVAFSCSLFGIVSAIVMTLVGVFANVADRRTALMVQIEVFLDNELQRAGVAPMGGSVASLPGLGASEDLRRVMAGFGNSVEQLQHSVTQFEAALVSFSTTTRDFREFNLHLKDNVQRMSLSFGDLSETLKDQVSALKARD
jgi:hypothetical protein